MTPCFILKRFAKFRDKAYRNSGFLTSNRAKAISALIKNAEHFSQSGEKVQLQVVRKLEKEIWLLLPDESSRFQKLRKSMIELIDKAKQNSHEKSL